jgi:hypothetical protein
MDLQSLSVSSVVSTAASFCFCLALNPFEGLKLDVIDLYVHIYGRDIKDNKKAIT